MTEPKYNRNYSVELHPRCREVELRTILARKRVRMWVAEVIIAHETHLVDEHRAQVLNYLNATGFKRGVLVNFGHHPKLEWERIVL